MELVNGIRKSVDGFQYGLRRREDEKAVMLRYRRGLEEGHENKQQTQNT